MQGLLCRVAPRIKMSVLAAHSLAKTPGTHCFCLAPCEIGQLGGSGWAQGSDQPISSQRGQRDACLGCMDGAEGMIIGIVTGRSCTPKLGLSLTLRAIFFLFYFLSLHLSICTVNHIINEIKTCP